MKLATLALALTVSASPAQAAPSWCPNAKHLDEIVICSNVPLWKADHMMWTKYHSHLGVARAKGVARLVQAQQQQWIASRRKCGANVTCLVQKYSERLENLTEMLGDIEDNAE
jgi:uncharacterized protein